MLSKTAKTVLLTLNDTSVHEAVVASFPNCQLTSLLAETTAEPLDETNKVAWQLLWDMAEDETCWGQLRPIRAVDVILAGNKTGIDVNSEQKLWEIIEKTLSLVKMEARHWLHPTASLPVGEFVTTPFLRLPIGDVLFSHGCDLLEPENPDTQTQLAHKIKKTGRTLLARLGFVHRWCTNNTQEVARVLAGCNAAKLTGSGKLVELAAKGESIDLLLQQWAKSSVVCTKSWTGHFSEVAERGLEDVGLLTWACLGELAARGRQGEVHAVATWVRDYVIAQATAEPTSSKGWRPMVFVEDLVLTSAGSGGIVFTAAVEKVGQKRVPALGFLYETFQETFGRTPTRSEKEILGSVRETLAGLTEWPNVNESSYVRKTREIFDTMEGGKVTIQNTEIAVKGLEACRWDGEIEVTLAGENPVKLLLEVDGEQHTQEVEAFQGDLSQRQRLDVLKTETLVNSRQNGDETRGLLVLDWSVLASAGSAEMLRASLAGILRRMIARKSDVCVVHQSGRNKRAVAGGMTWLNEYDGRLKTSTGWRTQLEPEPDQTVLASQPTELTPAT